MCEKNSKFATCGNDCCDLFIRNASVFVDATTYSPPKNNLEWTPQRVRSKESDKNRRRAWVRVPSQSNSGEKTCAPIGESDLFEPVSSVPPRLFGAFFAVGRHCGENIYIYIGDARSRSENTRAREGGSLQKGSQYCKGMTTSEGPPGDTGGHQIFVPGRVRTCLHSSCTWVMMVI